MSLEKASFCKINLLLNILGKRPDGFHELETVMQPLPVFDRLSFKQGGTGIQVTCTNPSLPTDSKNLVYRAAQGFFQAAGIRDGIRIHLEKNIPLAAGLGGGSGNAAATLLGLNELFGTPLQDAQLNALAASLGSDIPFFLQSGPAIATGRGEQIESLAPFSALRGAGVVLIHPGFGISTPWAYQQLARWPQALNGSPGRARKLGDALQSGSLAAAACGFYNALEAPALSKYPLLALFQQFLKDNGAAGALMSGSGSTTFAVTETTGLAETLAEKVRAKFGATHWISVVPAEFVAPALAPART